MMRDKPVQLHSSFSISLICKIGFTFYTYSTELKLIKICKVNAFPNEK